MDRTFTLYAGHELLMSNTWIKLRKWKKVDTSGKLLLKGIQSEYKFNARNRFSILAYEVVYVKDYGKK